MVKIFASGKNKMKFFMQNCKEKEEIRKLVEKYGGTMTRKFESDSIELVPFDVNFRIPAENAKDHPVYSFKIVKDSVTLGELQETKDYEIQIAHSKPIPAAKVGNRKQYSPEEDKLMTEYVEKHPGKSKSRSYWDLALKSGLGIDHSSESLKFHWSQLAQKLSQPKPKVNVVSLPQRRTRSFEKKENIPEESDIPEITPAKRVLRSSPSKSPQLEQARLTVSSENKLKYTPRSLFESGKSAKTVKSGISSLLEENLTFSDEIEQPRDICISVSDKERVVNDFSKLRRKCIENKIPFHFGRLVVSCRQVAGRFIPESEVLVTLIKNNGRVQDTLAEYENQA
ncbi:unnamed protein product [Blepharisma stoltei]|uniref:BRCT domain-containing protein n=1 Tax=Blepharisma stoltei TaxID=1481888 RepID=A0AAU9IMD4_9CILI|nr:unnamed protein product [Blepharisma stoltei]